MIINTIVDIATFWCLSHLVSAIVNQSNITVTKTVCLEILTKPPLTRAIMFAYVWKATS